jgi:gamma-glutamylcyclotransferase (GGCT)/AIG2-like uncharacterized protein YtfP
MAGRVSAWYFAYGSNMQTATFSGRRGIAFRRAVPGRLTGWRLVLDKPPLLPLNESYANIVPDPAAEVFGVLYEVAREDVEHIELTEGVPIGNYRRAEVVVAPLASPGDEPQRAFTLVSDSRVAEMLPSTRYMALLIAGALEHGLPGHYVDFLRSVPARPESAEAAELRPLIDQVLRRPGSG